MGTGSCGGGASTTGNIYGIYDMNGGANEFVMGYYTKVSSSSITKSGFETTTIPTLKYINGFSTTTIFSKKVEVIGHSASETYNWYSDDAGNLSSTNYWIYRSGGFNYSGTSGIFFARPHDGQNNSGISFRISVIYN